MYQRRAVSQECSHGQIAQNSFMLRHHSSHALLCDSSPLGLGQCPPTDPTHGSSHAICGDQQGQIEQSSLYITVLADNVKTMYVLVVGLHVSTGIDIDVRLCDCTFIFKCVR